MKKDKTKKTNVERIKLTNSAADALLTGEHYKKFIRLDIPVLKMFMLKDVFNDIKKALENFRANKNDILTKYSKKDDKGKALRDGMGIPEWINPESRAKAIEEIKEIGNIDLKIQPKKVEIHISDLPATMSLDMSDFLETFAVVLR